MGVTGIKRILLLAALATSLAACGRAGDPELPPAAAAAQKAKQPGAPAEDKPFILDPLI
ncbi:LPS translocon maturation chaperone LptM [Oricola nitratireducens]|jgi:predicted small lipoprotein YifL|uniref:LPS translocon maturation chaperone LptM n=1 Tax=Oricola nitratireducens TaxID=2775868 RepID=UPI001868FE9E|nr:lipoprotein [Oricola nitratireducens]